MMSLFLLRLPMVIIAYLLYMKTEFISAYSDKPKKKRAIHEFNYWNVSHEMVLHRAKKITEKFIAS